MNNFISGKVNAAKKVSEFIETCSVREISCFSAGEVYMWDKIQNAKVICPNCKSTEIFYWMKYKCYECFYCKKQWDVDLLKLKKLKFTK